MRFNEAEIAGLAVQPLTPIHGQCVRFAIDLDDGPSRAPLTAYATLSRGEAEQLVEVLTEILR